GNSIQPLVSAQATCTTSSLSVGGSPHPITAQYGGDANLSPSTSNIVQQNVQNCANPAVVKNTADSGADSLRDALSTVCDGGTITFQAGVTGTITLASQLLIDKNVTINGPGADVLTVAGNNTFRLVNVTLPANGTATIKGLSFTGGKSDTAGLGTNGAAIEFNNVGTLNLINSEFFANSMTGSLGDVIYTNAAAKLNVSACTFRNNTTRTAIHIGSTPADIVNSTVSNNASSYALAVDNGAAVNLTN